VPEGYADQVWDVVRTLCLSGLVVFAFKQARSAGESKGRLLALRNGLGFCLGFALFAAFTAGSATCAEGDPLNGACIEYYDNGHYVSRQERGERFLFWSLLLGVPVVLGAMDARKYAVNPWRKPTPPQV
jgi:hypothetical protein